MKQLEVQRSKGGLSFRLRVSPKAKRDQLGEIHDGALKISVTAPPVDGAANAAIIRLLAKKLGLPKRALTVVRGQSGRDKVVRVDGLEPGELGARLGVELG